MSWNFARLGPIQLLVFLFFTTAFSSDLSLGQQFDPDSICYSDKVREDFNPYDTLYRMCSWKPVQNHLSQPHSDGDAIQIIADGGNGIQDPPQSDGSPGGDDSLADGNFNVQYVNGEKHEPDGLTQGMFVGMMYFVPYKPNMHIYLRIWEGTDPARAEFYQDSEEYTTFYGDTGGAMVELRSDWLDDMDWKFGMAKRVERRK
jgi:hypothetical protein